MIRIALILSVILGLCACPPSRGGGDDGPSDTSNAGMSYAWLVISSVGEETSVSHSFARWNRGSGLCSSVRNYYEGSADGYTAYYQASTELSQEFADDPDRESDPEYRRRTCEMYADYYGSFYTGDLYDEGSEQMWLSLGGPEGSPAAGTYTVGSDGPEDEGGDDTFSSSRTRYLADYASLMADVDCDAYANDPDAVLFEELEDLDVSESWSLVGGSLDVTAAGADAWHLVLTDGVEASDEDEEEGPVELDGTFDRCEIEYEYDL